MSKPTRKPPVLAIRGNAKRDTVKQSELRGMAVLQEAEWLANRMAQKSALEIESRVAHGAAIEPGPLTWDADLKMVRRKKVG